MPIRPQDQFEDVKKKVVAGIESAFPVSGRQHELRVKNVEVKDNKDLGDFTAQIVAKNTGRSWTVPVVGDLQLVDKRTGKVLDTRKGATLAQVPKITDRFSYIVKGNEYQMDHIWRRKPGVYSRIKENGELQAEFNLAKGKNFEIVFDPKKRKFNIGYANSTIPLYPVLKAMGATDDQLKAQWGKDILEANRVKNELNVLRKFSKALGGSAKDSGQEAVERIKGNFANTELSPETTEITLGTPSNKVDTGVLLRSANKLLSVSRGKTEPDNRDALKFKTLHGLGDLLFERINKNSRRLNYKVRNNVDRRKKITEVFSPQIYSGVIKSQFTEDSLAQLPDQNNPLDNINGALRTTILGSGGIGSEQQIIASAKSVDPSHLGFLDTIYTPEGSRAGVTSHMALGAGKRGTTPTTRVYDLKNKKSTEVDAVTMSRSKVVMPDQVRWVNGVPRARGNKVKSLVGSDGFDEIPLSKADYVFPVTSAIFGMGTNLVPFLQNNSANRISMASRTLSQAVGLKDREPPLVQAEAAPGISWDMAIGDGFSLHAPEDGIVDRVGESEIRIRTKGGKIAKVPLYHNFPLNMDGNFYHHTPKVKKGDKVRKDQIIGDLNHTRDGQLALGKNMYVGYVSIPGRTFEDGIIVSEDAAKKLASEHMYRYAMGLGSETVKDARKFQAYYPTAYTKGQLEKVDPEGVIKKGSLLMPGDPIMVGLEKKPITAEGKAIARLHRSLVKPYRDISQKWEKDVPGQVVDVIKGAKETRVHIKTTEPAVEGDKLVGRHGNKGVISAVLPATKMPKDKQGKSLDVALTPYGVPGRQNIGQLYELAAAKIAEKQGKPLLVPNFATEDTHSWLKKELKKHGISEQEELYDPETGRSIGKVMAGPLYLTKMKHMVEHKYKARAGGPGNPYDINRSPKRGGAEGGQALGALDHYALLGHGALATIREAHTYKSDMDAQEELWRALQLGTPLPPPKVPFVYNKFENYLKGLGVDVIKSGNTLQIQPVSEQQIKDLASGKITKATTFRAKDLKPEPDGIFDPEATGGIEGSQWARYELPEVMPNPLYEKGIQAVTGLTKRELRDIVAGEKALAQYKQSAPGAGWEVVNPQDGGLTGGDAIKAALDSVDVKREIKGLEEQIPKLGGQLLDKAHRRLRYLKALDATGMKPSDAYMTKNVPVMPPMMRPVMVLPSGDLSIDNMNELYRGIILTGNSLQEAKRNLPAEQQRPIRKELYDGLVALSGIGAKRRVQGDDLAGILQTLHGDTLKSGYFQSKLIKRRQDLSARSTIVPNPSLALDEVGIPKPMAMTTYKPFVVRELTTLGYSPLQAQELIKNNSSIADKALEKATESRPTLMKRDPVLHKYGIMAFKPKIVGGKAIQIHPLITGPYGADFDGDCHYNQLLMWVPAAWYSLDKPFWDLRSINLSARFKEAVGVVDEEGVFAVCSLEDFPHDGITAKKKHIEFYSVPKDIRVVALDEAEGRPILARVSDWSVHKQREVEIVTLGSGRQIVTDDDERAVYGVDLETLEWCRRRPSEANGIFVPVIDEALVSPDAKLSLRMPDHDRIREEIPLGFDEGWFFGFMAGNGWGDGYHMVAATSYGEVEEAWMRVVSSLFRNETPIFSHNFETKNKLKGSKGSGKVGVSSVTLATWIDEIVGKYAENKHLPPFAMATSEGFKRGLIAGLWDSDGSVSWSNAKKQPQFLCTYSSTSLRLIQEIQHLLLSLGLTSTIVPSTTPKGGDYWVLTVSTVSLHKFGGFALRNKRKLALMQEFLGCDPPDDKGAYSRFRLVPLPADLGRALRAHVSRKDHKDVYGTLSGSISRQYISKNAALHVLRAVKEDVDHPLYEKWKRLVEMPGMHFERVKEITKTGIKEDGYDLTVPGYETFMATDGVVLSNSMAIYTPVSNEAVKEAYGMMPSKNLFSPATGRVMYTPSNETVLGLYKLTKFGKGKPKNFDSLDEAIKALDQGSVKVDSPIKVGKLTTTPGRAKLYNMLPADTRDPGILTDKDLRFNSKGVKKFLTDIARNKPGRYSDTAKALVDAGDREVYERAHSYSLEDFQPDKATREKYLKPIADQWGKIDPSTMIDKLVGADKKMTKEHISKFWDSPNNLQLMVQAGVKPAWGQYKQMIMSPVMMEDSKGRPIPNPITRSLSEGMDTTGMFLQSMGTRESIRKKTQEVMGPGALTKRAMNTVMDTLVGEEDCGTKRGETLSIAHPDTVDRYLAKSVGGIPANTLVSPAVIQKLKKKGIRELTVRSPNQCELPKGICSKCFGLSEHGHDHPKGTNIGVLAGQSIGERSTQLMLKAVHFTGSMDSGGSAMNQFDRVEQLLRMPKRIPDAATLATKSGKVTKVKKDPAGGHAVEIDGEGHYVPQRLGLAPGVKAGSTVRKGQQISGGYINVHDLLPITGIEGVRKQISDELDQIYGSEGVRRRNVEVLARGITNLGQVEDPGDKPDIVKGDYIPISVAQAWNRDPNHKKPVKYHPILKGVNELPHAMTEDWLARLNHTKIKDTIIEAANQGWVSDLHSTNPIPAMVTGSEFGKVPFGY